MLADALKGAVPVFVLPSQLDWSVLRDGNATMIWALAIGVAAILGHSRPVFLLWRGGGKGVATGAGVFAALAPAAFVAAFIAFGVTLFLSGFVSLASLVAAWAIPLAVAVTGGLGSPLFLVAVGVAAFVTWAHRGNIARLRAGTEPRTFGQPTGGVE
jgi:glycerol-3-phosphate acyltransferase PlsY